MKMSNQSRVQSPAVFAALRRAKESRVQQRRTGDCGLRTGNCESAFTLIALLVVISILGILAALTMPALKNFAKSDATISASRQLLDDVGRARQLAISQRTTVYMVFVPTNFWAPNWWDTKGQNPAPAWSSLTPAQQTAATNLCDKQLTGYTFVSLRSVGDQPGQGVPRYLAPWQELPEGAFIAAQKFFTTNTIVDAASSASYPIPVFSYSNLFPFPTETTPMTPNPPPYLPTSRSTISASSPPTGWTCPAPTNTSRSRKAAFHWPETWRPRRCCSIRRMSWKSRPATAPIPPTTSSTLTG